MYSLIRTTHQFVRLNLNKPVVRHKRGMPKRKRMIDPGLQNRKALIDDDKDLNEMEDYDFEIEGNFMNAGEAHKQSEQEEMVRLEHQKHLIVGQKYFKQKLPNFLTWSDKEQIRYLYNTNPEEWDIERLSEGFPALPDVIAKVAKTTWTKNSENKIHNHDEAVRNNWKKFKEGEFKNLPPDLAEHLQKFTNRELTNDFKIKKNVAVRNNKNLKMGNEFGDIIRSYKKLKSDDNDTSSNEDCVKDSNTIKQTRAGDTYFLNYKSSITKKHTTLNNLKEEIKLKDLKGDTVPEEKLILDELEDGQETSVQRTLPQPTMNIDTHLEKYPTKKCSKAVSTFDNTSKGIMVYPEKIIIPKNKYKPGYTYKLNDCYYDDDGEFLYRVPGMYK